MRAVRLILSAAALLAISASANATVETITADGQRYVWLEPATMGGSAQVEHISAFPAVERPKRVYYERAFYTPTPNYEQEGYLCTGLVSVSYVGRVKHMHRGTYCAR